jgi:MSHA biogenesis protein MshK
MAGGLKSIAALVAFCALAAAGSALAQLADPTRPSGTPVGGATPAAAAASGLQSVILRKHGKPAALINGTVVELGGMVGEMKLVAVKEDAVVLRGPGGDETLRLMPAAEKKPEKTAKVGPGGTAGKKEKDR